MREISRTRVAIRKGKRVLVKKCRRCGQTKIVTTNSATSGFYVRLRPLADGVTMTPSWGPLCKECVKLGKREQYAALDREARREKRRAVEARLRADPERLAIKRLRHREAEQRRLAAMTPEQLEEWRQKRRDAHKRWVERNPDYYYNRQAKKKAEAESASAERGTIRPRVAAGPFRAWLLAYQEAMGLPSMEAVALDLGLVNRRTRAVMADGQPEVTFDTVDLALMHARTEVEVDGRTIWSVADLYPDGAPDG